MLLRQGLIRGVGRGTTRLATRGSRIPLSTAASEPASTASTAASSGGGGGGGGLVFAGVTLGAAMALDYSNGFRFLRAAYLAASDSIAVPLMRTLLDAETAHGISIKATSLGLAPTDASPPDPVLQTKVMGLTFPSAVGLAAGYDKNAEAVDGLMGMGFGFIEIGSVTPEPQPGNDKPRMFRLVEDKGIINRCGFNNDGVKVVGERLQAWRRAHEQSPPVGLLGVNVGKNKWVTEDKAADDYVAAIKALGPYGDFIVVNVSSPNTPGLRNLQRRDAIGALIGRACAARDEVKVATKRATLPLLVKIAPDLTDAEKADIAAVALKTKVDGLIVSNTTIARPDTLQGKAKGETGGLSGLPLRDKATTMVHDMYKLTKGKVPLIGVGGVGNGQEAYDKIRAGASLVQLYSMIVYNGPGCVQRTKAELSALLKRDGYANVSEAVGAAHRVAKGAKK